MATTVQVIGNKGKLLILRNLLVRPWRFQVSAGHERFAVSGTLTRQQATKWPGSNFRNWGAHTGKRTMEMIVLIREQLEMTKQ